MANESCDRRIRKSKAALKESLLALMEQKNFEDISITDIVRAAELNRGTFYKHYQVKEELLNELLDDVAAEFIEAYRAPYRNKQTFEVKHLTASAITLYDHVQRNARFYTLLVMRNAFGGFQNRICGILKNLYLEDVTDMSPSPKIDQELLAGFRAHAVFGLIAEWVKGGFKYSSTYMAEQTLEIIRKNQENDAYATNLSRTEITR